MRLATKKKNPPPLGFSRDTPVFTCAIKTLNLDSVLYDVVMNHVLDQPAPFPDLLGVLNPHPDS